VNDNNSEKSVVLIEEEKTRSPFHVVRNRSGETAWENSSRWSGLQ